MPSRNLAGNCPECSHINVFINIKSMTYDLPNAFCVHAARGVDTVILSGNNRSNTSGSLVSVRCVWKGELELKVRKLPPFKGSFGYRHILQQEAPKEQKVL